MLHVYLGTDRKRVRDEMNTEIARFAKAGKARVVRVSDVQGPDDVRAALAGGGLFAEARVVVFDGLMAKEEMHEVLVNSLERIAAAPEPFFILEEKLLANEKRMLEKYAQKIHQFDASKKKDSASIFGVARSLERADKKALWLGLEKEIAAGEAPEAIHGVLFWGAKQALLSARAGSAEERRGKKFVAELAELPHAARRGNMPLEYALLRFALSVA